ncbi:MAG TPA: Trm112 family protein [Terracidiphilus sp.]|jgi:uncharacterized protein YbaR (Trm112 family)|nr:Trm112 family protein [Terracidiphilus sp.]
MPPDSHSGPSQTLATWADDLACPACAHTLRIEQTRIVCNGCSRSYPILDGIPVLIIDRAEQIAPPK